MSAPVRAGPADAALIAALHEVAYGRNRRLLGAEPLPLQVEAGELVRTKEVWLFEESDAPAGVLALEPQADAMLIWSVATTPAAQGRGIGGTMLDFAEHHALELGFELMRLYTGAKLTSNVAWYQRRGYQIDRVRTLADRDIVHMSKSLAGG